MALPKRVSLLFFIGFFIAGSTALGYYYYFVYEPPLKAAEQFIHSRQGLDISGWSHERLDNELTALADAYVICETEESR